MLHILLVIYLLSAAVSMWCLLGFCAPRLTSFFFLSCQIKTPSLASLVPARSTCKPLLTADTSPTGCAACRIIFCLGGLRSRGEQSEGRTLRSAPKRDIFVGLPQPAPTSTGSTQRRKMRLHFYGVSNAEKVAKKQTHSEGKFSQKSILFLACAPH